MPWGGLANTTWRWMKHCWKKSRAMAAPISASIAGTLQHSPWDGINRTRSTTFRSCAGPPVDKLCGMSTSSHTPPSRLSRCLGHSGKRIVRSTLDSREHCGLWPWRRYSLRLIRPSAHPPSCFAPPVGGEILVSGRKLVGSAQVRRGEAFLQHGSILLDGTQPGGGAETTMASALGRSVCFDELAGAIIVTWGEPFLQSDRPTVRPSDIASLVLR